jgi:hypothetical protein
MAAAATAPMLAAPSVTNLCTKRDTRMSISLSSDVDQLPILVTGERARSAHRADADWRLFSRRVPHTLTAEETEIPELADLRANRRRITTTMIDETG